jgi:signal transduction histidine kinase
MDRAPEALIGQPLAAFAPPEWRAFVETKLQARGSEAAPWRGEFPLLGADGKPVYLEWNVSSHVEPGVRIAIAIDVSERYELEQRRRDVLEREQAARRLAERHSRTKDDFIAVLSHELRTPLNAIIGWVHILRRRGMNPEGAKGLDAIERNVKTQARIISDILDVSRINSGKLRLEPEWTDPRAIPAPSRRWPAPSTRSASASTPTCRGRTPPPGWTRRASSRSSGT